MNFRQYFQTTFTVDALVAVCVFGIVVLTLSFALYRFRAGRRHEASRKSEHNKLEITYVCLLVLIGSGLCAFSLSENSLETAPLGKPALTVDVTGFRWCWSFHYAHTPVTIIENCDPKKPTLVLPEGRIVEVHLTSNDVVHEFWIPAFRWKIEAFPDHVNKFQLRTDRTGDWVGRCTVFCGLYHYRMDFSVKVVTDRAFASFMTAHGAASRLAL